MRKLAVLCSPLGGGAWRQGVGGATPLVAFTDLLAATIQATERPPRRAAGKEKEEQWTHMPSIDSSCHLSVTSPGLTVLSCKMEMITPFSPGDIRTKLSHMHAQALRLVTGTAPRSYVPLFPVD